MYMEEYVFCRMTFKNKHLKSADLDLLGLTEITIKQSTSRPTPINLNFALLKDVVGAAVIKDNLVMCGNS